MLTRYFWQSLPARAIYSILAVLSGLSLLYFLLAPSLLWAAPVLAMILSYLWIELLVVIVIMIRWGFNPESFPVFFYLCDYRLISLSGLDSSVEKAFGHSIHDSEADLRKLADSPAEEAISDALTRNENFESFISMARTLMLSDSVSLYRYARYCVTRCLFSKGLPLCRPKV